MKRLFWMGLGVAAGVGAVRQVSKRTRFFSSRSNGKEAVSIMDAAREFGESVRNGMREREDDLRVALGVAPGEMDADSARRLLDHPATSEASHDSDSLRP